jgi:hypothetical protein
MTRENYFELLAEERAETERLFILKVLARKDANKRRLSGRGWMVVEGQGRNDASPRP